MTCSPRELAWTLLAGTAVGFFNFRGKEDSRCTRHFLLNLQDIPRPQYVVDIGEVNF